MLFDGFINIPSCLDTCLDKDVDGAEVEAVPLDDVLSPSPLGSGPSFLDDDEDEPLKSPLLLEDKGADEGGGGIPPPPSPARLAVEFVVASFHPFQN